MNKKIIDVIENFLKNYEEKEYITICSRETDNIVDEDFKCKIYNEFSLQHELGLYFRNNLEYSTILFEKNVKSFNGGKIFKNWEKHEIDIVIIDNLTNKKYAVELKFPLNGQYPEQMFQFTKDICFMEQVKKYIKFEKTFCLTLVNDYNFYEANKNQKTDGIYKYFRIRSKLSGLIKDPVNHKNSLPKEIKLSGNYNINWKSINNNKYLKYYLVEAD